VKQRKRMFGLAAAVLLIVGIPVALNSPIAWIVFVVIAAGFACLWQSSRYWFERVAKLFVVVLGVALITFGAIRTLPGDPALIKAGPGATPEQLVIISKELGLDKPVPVQFGIFLRDTFTGDFGVSYAFNTPVSELLTQRLPKSLVIMLYAQFLALGIAIPVGVWCAYRAGGAFDRIATTTAFGLLSVPNYIIGVLLVFVFALRFGWFRATFTDNEFFLKTYFLPSITLALGQLAGYLRLLRSDMINTLQNDFVTMARAKGMSTGYILFRHAFRPSTFSLITSAAIQVGALIGGTLIVEQIFAIPGMGNLIVEAIFRRDFPVVQICVVLLATAFVLVNFFVDVAYAWLDPRVKAARALA
jgi:peptide/nickel transport system permease protein